MGENSQFFLLTFYFLPLSTDSYSFENSQVGSTRDTQGADWTLPYLFTFPHILSPIAPISVHLWQTLTLGQILDFTRKNSDIAPFHLDISKELQRRAQIFSP